MFDVCSLGSKRPSDDLVCHSLPSFRSSFPTSSLSLSAPPLRRRQQRPRRRPPAHSSSAAFLSADVIPRRSMQCKTSPSPSPSVSADLFNRFGRHSESADWGHRINRGRLFGRVNRLRMTRPRNRIEKEEERNPFLYKWSFQRLRSAFYYHKHHPTPCFVRPFVSLTETGLNK